MTNIDEKGKTNILVSRTRKRRFEEIEDDYRDSLKKKFEEEKQIYQDEIQDLKLQMKEFDIIKLQNEDAHYKLQALYGAGIIDANSELIGNMN